MKYQMTRQGVRNLDVIKSKPRKQYEMPPIEAMGCSHPKTSIITQVNDRTGGSRGLCGDCDAVVWEKSK